MNPRKWLYFIKQALGNISSNRLVHVVGMTTMLISLLIFGTFLLLFVNLNNWIQGWGQSLSMSVYLKDDISEQRREQVASFIKTLPSAEIKRFVTKEKALGEFKKALGSKAGLLDGLSKNPLPASFEIVFKQGMGQDEAQKVKTQLEKMEGVEEAQYSEQWVKKFEGLMYMVRLLGFIVGGLLCVGVLFIVTNTIKLTIYSRREEIEIFKLVGATDWFIKVPFLLEGMIQGALSGLLSLVILFSGYIFLSVRKMSFLGLAALDFSFLPHQYSLALFSLSVALGLVGSFIAIGRFFEA